MDPRPMAGLRRTAVLATTLALLTAGISPAIASDEPTPPDLRPAPAVADALVDDVPEQLRAGDDSAVAFAQRSLEVGGAPSASAEALAVDGTASIGGRITYWSAGSGGRSLAGAAVEAWAEAADGTGAWNLVADAVTDASGAYAITGLPAGSYLVNVYDPRAGTPLIPEFYEDAQYTDLATLVTVADGQAATGVDEELEPLMKGRIAGQDRFETAVAASRAGFEPGVPCVWIANGLAFPDALSAGPAAARCGGPLLLVPGTRVPSSVIAELKRLKPAKIVVAGGTGAVSSSVETTLRSLAPSFTRYAGTDRYDTSRKIVAGAFGTSPAVWVASGANFPDALSASGAAAAIGIPVLIVPGTRSGLDSAATRALTSLDADVVAIAGGTGAISSGIQRAIQALPTGPEVHRFGGADRYATAYLIVDAVWGGGWSPYAFFASGRNFPDALAAAPLAGWIGAPLYITPDSCTSSAVQQHVASVGVAEGYVMGYYQPVWYSGWTPFRTC
ncbi:hypothetical protein GCM10009819_17310 [Agromyces tropicus]|uniref:Cell wall-binding repeat-containing protein n=1 Tax=Agromyces tropicus TaxID=555371 RepID=A0ABP5FZ15_9MICO